MEDVKSIRVEIDNGIKKKFNYKAFIDEVSTELVRIHINNKYTLNPQELIELVINDIVTKKFNTVTETKFYLLKELLTLQLCFYSLIDDKDLNIGKIYVDLYENHVEVYESFINKINDQCDTIELPLSVCLTRPLAENIILLNRFHEAAKITVDISYKYIEGTIIESGEKGIMPLWFFHKNVIGDETAWEETIHLWKVCFYVCNKFKKEGMSKTNIVKHMESAKSLFSNIQDMPNSIHKLNKLLGKAEQLISSAKRGTFPI